MTELKSAFMLAATMAILTASGCVEGRKAKSGTRWDSSLAGKGSCLRSVKVDFGNLHLPSRANMVRGSSQINLRVSQNRQEGD